jgi:ParB family transcriptional regulator, chromosome partitioning protein
MTTTDAHTDLDTTTTSPDAGITEVADFTVGHLAALDPAEPLGVPAEPGQESGAEPPKPEILDVDPKTLVIGANVRLEPRLDKPFIASIRERGVLEPIIAYRDDDQRLVVLRGQRRTLAAVEAKRPSVRVIVLAAQDEIDRILDQLSENHHRTGITDDEEVAGIEQLTLLGLSAGQIAKRTARKRPVVQAALATIGSPLARGALERWDFLDLEHAAVLAEFDDDQDAVTQLVNAARNGGFAHLAQRLRDAREERALITARAEELAEAGVTVVERPGYGSSSRMRRLGVLQQDGQDLDEQNHAGCPGHAAYLQVDWLYDDGDNEDTEDDVDEQDGPLGTGADSDEDDATPSPPPQKPSRQVVTHFVCTDPPKHGHTDVYTGRADQRPAHVQRHGRPAARGRQGRPHRRYRVQQGVA